MIHDISDWLHLALIGWFSSIFIEFHERQTDRPDRHWQKGSARDEDEWSVRPCPFFQIKLMKKCFGFIFPPFLCLFLQFKMADWRMKKQSRYGINFLNTWESFAEKVENFKIVDFLSRTIIWTKWVSSSSSSSSFHILMMGQLEDALSYQVEVFAC